MNKYPLDGQAIQDIVKDILQHNIAQLTIIQKLETLLQDAVDSTEDEDQEWYQDAEEMLQSFRARKTEYENHRFNQSNGHNLSQNSPGIEVPPLPAVAANAVIDPLKEAQLNALEAGEGEMDEAEVAKIFNEKPPKKKKEKSFKKMSLEEIEDWEKAQDNSNDIYKVSARVKNLARAAVKGNLTQQGDMVVNMFTHLFKSFYDFAETVSDKETKIKLIEMTRKQEELPGSLLSALGSGVRAAQ